MESKVCYTNATDPEAGDQQPLTTDCALFDFILYSIIGGTLCIVGLIGNALSFLVLRLKDNAKSSTTFLLRALAVADALVLMASIPLYLLQPVHAYTGHLQGYYDLYVDIMPFLWPLYLMPYTGTIMLTVLVSFNRYLAACRPFSSVGNRGKDTETRRHVAIVCFFSVLYNIPRFFEYHRVETCDGETNSTKQIFELSEFGNNKVYRILYTNLLYFIVMHGGPLTLLAFLNVKLIAALKAQNRRRREMIGGLAGAGGGTSGAGSSTAHSQQQDLTLVLIVVVFFFICCQTPTFVDHILWTVVDKTETECGRWHYYYTAVADLMAILNSSVNFIIYVLTSRRFRRDLLVLCCRCGRRTRDSVPGGRTMTTDHPAMVDRCVITATRSEQPAATDRLLTADNSRQQLISGDSPGVDTTGL